MTRRRYRRFAWIVLLVLQMPLINGDGPGSSSAEGSAANTNPVETTSIMKSDPNRVDSLFTLEEAWDTSASTKAAETTSITSTVTTTEAVITTANTERTTSIVTSEITSTVTTTEALSSSTTSETTTTSTIPPCCSEYKVTELNFTNAKSNSLELRWKDPPSCGGWPIESYKIVILSGIPPMPNSDKPHVNLTIPPSCVSASDDFRTLVLNSSTCDSASLDARLLPCTPYHISVSVIYGSCRGATADIQTYTAPSSDQNHVTSLTVNDKTSFSFRLSWERPSCLYVINQYRVTVTSSEGSHTQEGIPETNSYLVNATFGRIEIHPCSEYTVDVVPIFDHGFNGVSKKNQTAVTLSERISIENLTHLATDSDVTLTWKLETPDSCDGKIREFRVTYRTEANSTTNMNATCDSNQCNYVIRDLSPCSKYIVSLSTVDVPFDTGSPASIKDQRILTQPGNYGDLRTLTAVPEDTSIELRWEIQMECRRAFTSAYVSITARDGQEMPLLIQVPRNCMKNFTLVIGEGNNCSEVSLPQVSPCSVYNIALLPVYFEIYNSTGNNTETVTKPGPYGNVTDLRIGSAGPDWLQVQWSLSSRCYSSLSSINLTMVDKDTPSPSKPLAIPAACIAKNDSTHIISLNISSSGGSFDPRLKLGACGRYSIEILPIFQGNYEGTFGQVEGYTNPGSLGAVLDVKASDVGTTSLKIQWRLSSRCFRRFTAVNLTVKEEGGETSPPLLIPANCTTKGHGNFSLEIGSNRACPEANQVEIQPCRRYQVEVEPIYADLFPGEANRTSAVTEPGNDGRVLDLTTVNTGVDWLQLQWRISSRCSAALVAVDLNVTSSDGSPVVQMKVEKSHLTEDNDTFSFNVTRNDSVPLTACTLFDVLVHPFFFEDMNYAGDYGKTEAVTQPGDGAIVKDLNTTDRGDHWIQLSWKTPECSSTANLLGYNITVQENVTIQLNASIINTTDVVTFNLTQGHCGTSNCSLELTSCTPYTIAVEPQFEITLDRNGTTATSIKTFTLAAANDTLVHLQTQSSSSDGFLLVWEEPSCRIAFHSWDIRIVDPHGNSTNLSCPKDQLISDQPGFYQLSVTSPIRCGNYSQDLSITPCTNYSTYVNPVIPQIYVDDRANQDSVRTRLDYPSAVGNLTTERGVDSLYFTWAPPEKNPTCVESYGIFLTDNQDGTFFADETVNTWENVSSLKPCSNYVIRIETLHFESKSESLPFLNETVTTKQQAPGPPQNLAASHRDFNMTLTWMAPVENPQCLDGYNLSVSRWVNASYNDMENFTVLNHDTDRWTIPVQAGSNYTIQLVAYAKGEFPGLVLPSVGETITYSIPPATGPALDTAAMAISVAVVLLVVFCIAGFLVYKRRAGLDRLITRTVSSARSTFGSAEELETLSRPLTVWQLATGVNWLFQDGAYEITMEYEQLRKRAASKNYPKTAAENPANKEKNRYINILPFDHSRVQLTAIPGDPTSDYINASYVKDLEGKRRYIAAQGPKVGTVSDFWEMMWERNVRIVIMLTGLEEQGRAKCAQYWPDLGCAALYNRITVSTAGEEVTESYTIRSLLVTGRKGEARIVHHVHFTQWPDFGCPRDPEHLLTFVEMVQSSIAALPSNSPILVHCSAGVGRTGTFIAVDLLTQEALAGKRIDIFNTVLRLRNDRTNMVQTEDQYVFVYQCMVHFAQTRVNSSATGS